MPSALHAAGTIFSREQLRFNRNSESIVLLCSHRPWMKAMRHFALIALSIMPLGGCGYVTATAGGDVTLRYDASTGADKAIIAGPGRQPFDPACRIVRDNGLYREVVVDAGEVVLQVECSRFTGVFGEQTEHLGSANLAFHAEAGRHYRIEFSDDFGFAHVAVSVNEEDSPVIQRSLLGSRFDAHAGAAHVTLVSRSGSGVIPCKFGRPWTDGAADSVRRPAGSFVHVPYSHQIVAECATYAYFTGYVKERYEALVDFKPVSGRLYTVHMDEKNPDFVFVTDVSSEVRTITHVKAVKIY